ncbi:hypothetical protein Dred_0791 [Desulforamulus reducens MI-1]|uniref:Uncharacterized protein n=1 Tax=Desulforamulus reducens (strain ATCC BAA-1160 / DSM 100696 / MI-1) TaxID=349161 RepID=A4J2M6_DESRM|nr:hypothetical protein [Desulforamulus reducens]ABO49329.1 hypothetical protein Dred_0791 [Desulforamulus reducens MI-1]
MKRKLIGVWVVGVICLLIWFPKQTLAMGMIDTQSAVVGKILNYDKSCDTYTVYGRRSVMTKNGWQVVETQKFYHVIPMTDTAKQKLRQGIGSGVKAFGVTQTATGLREQNLLAETVLPYNPDADRAAGVSAAFGPAEGPFDWIGFGVANRPTYLSTIELKKEGQGEKITEFVNALATIRDALFNSDGEESKTERSASQKLPYILHTIEGDEEKNDIYTDVYKWWKANIDTKWYLEKDLDTLNQLGSASGGLAFFKGKVGSNGGYIESVPAIRPNIEKYMNKVGGGGSSYLEKTPGIFFGSLTYDRETKTLYVSGPFYKRIDSLVNDMEAVKSGLGSTQRHERWEVKGVSPSRMDVLLKNKCWVSGRKVLNYEKGKLIDYYFSVDKTLTVNEFNSALDFIRDISLKGGM